MPGEGRGRRGQPPFLGNKEGLFVDDLPGVVQGFQQFPYDDDPLKAGGHIYPRSIGQFYQFSGGQTFQKGAIQTRFLNHITR
jgi:hypothetical protein